MYQVPGRPSGWLVVASCAEREDDYGYRLFLMEPSDTGAAIIAQTPGLMDADWVDPVWFLAPGRTLLLADIGSESSWGIIAYEVTSAGLRSLGIVPAAKPGVPEMGWHESALPYAKVRITPSGYVVEFAGDVMFDPAGPEEYLIRGARRLPVRFRWMADRFVLDP
jgi:hypothetical protein